MRLLRYWGEFLAWIVGMGIAFEILCRLVITNTPEVIIERYGPITAPNRPVIESNEGFSRNRTNEIGNIDGPMPDPRPPDGILVTGDSLSEGLQVDLDERYTGELARALHRHVYNAAHSAWSLVNEVAFLETEIPTYAPSVIVVQTSGYDLKEMTHSQQAHLVENAGGKFGFDFPVAKNSKLHELVLTRSAFVRRLVHRAKSLLFKRRDPDDRAKEDLAIPPIARRALPFLLGEMTRVHAHVILLYIPKLDYHHGCVDRWVEARQLFEQTAAQVGLEMVDVTDAMCARFRETGQPLSGFWNTIPGAGHLNTLGHEVLGQALAQRIRDKHL